MKHSLLAAWRSLPASVRRAAHRVANAPGVAVAWLDQRRTLFLDHWAEYAALARARRRARRPKSVDREPVTIIGYLSAVHGLGEGARSLARGFSSIGLDVRAVDLSDHVGLPMALPVSLHEPQPGERGTLISHINPQELLGWATATEGRLLEGRYHIGYWAWELEEAPAEWIPAFDFVDEVWTPSEFAADAIRRIAPKRIKVSAAPYPIYLNARPDADRSRFGLPEHRVVVFTAFDLRSTAQRKNPRAALAAFQHANRRLGGDALLLCKVVGGDLYPETLAALAAEVADDPSIRLMTDNLTSAEMAVLTASVDIVLSLHRSEGYGLLLAEAIWQGKPTVATGWSANSEFMDPQSSALVDFRLVPVEGDGVIYRQGRWADADVMDAADALFRLISDERLRAAWATATQNNRHVSFDSHSWRRLVTRLIEARARG